MRSSQAVIAKLYRETGAGGFAHVDQIAQFYFRVNALLKPNMVLLDLGAGRGKIAESPPSFIRDLAIFKGRCSKVYGADIDVAVMTNPTVDEAIIIANDHIPLPDQSVDLVFSAATFEHIAHPKKIADELRRLLRPGGWICAWTPNKRGYVALGAQLIPNRLHAHAVAAAMPGGRKAIDVFPTVYKLNTLRAIRRYFPPEYFTDYSYYLPGVPSYNGGSFALGWLLNTYNTTMPRFLMNSLHVFLQKL